MAHDQGRGHSHADNENGSLVHTLLDFVPFLHKHEHGTAHIDDALESSERGINALKISFLVLLITALFQVVIVVLSGSVALLADTVHNFADSLTAVPLWIAFSLGRRAATRRYTYGYGRAEDLAGVLIVLVILASAVVAAYESYHRLLHPQDIDHVGWVLVASVIGFLGNEVVAMFRIRVGKEISSAALVADGRHAQADGLTSLAVLFGALGVMAGIEEADPVIGLLISVAILFIVKDAATPIWHRLMDGVDPEIVTQIQRIAEDAIEGRRGVEGISDLRVRWLGHRLQAEFSLIVDEDMPTRESHAEVEAVRHALLHREPRLSSIIVHVEPCGHGGDPHETTSHHR